MSFGRNVASFILGGCVGAIATYYITRDIERSRADEEINSMKAHYEKKEKKLLEKAEAADKRVQAALKAKNSYEETVINLGATLDRIKKDSENSEESEDKGESEDDSDISPEALDHPREDDYYEVSSVMPVPYQILEEEYAESYPDIFDKVVLNWYLGDDILSSDDGRLVDDRVKLVGDLTEFKKTISPGSELYIRNESRGADYLINIKAGKGIDSITGGNLYED